MADRSVGAFALVVDSDAGIRLGLRANWRQFALLVVLNAFVGAMVGLERAIMPALGEMEFGVASRAALLSFIASFGATKALTIQIGPATYELLKDDFEFEARGSVPVKGRVRQKRGS